MIKMALYAIPLVIMNTSPVHAISETYRSQLERSGCTQVTDGHGCDIHKTRAQNDASAAKPALSPEQQHGQIVGEAETILAMKGIAAEEYLVEKGWKQQSSGKWIKAGHVLSIVEDDGVVRSAQLIK